MKIYEFSGFKVSTNHEFLSEKNQANIDFYLEVNGQKFWGSAFTLENIKYLMDTGKENGGNFNGNFFWSANAIIIRKMSVECLGEVLAFLIEKREHELILHAVESSPRSLG